MDLVFTINKEREIRSALDENFISKTNKNMILVSSGESNTLEMVGDSLVVDTLVTSLYALVTGATNYKPTCISKVVADFGLGCFIEMNDKTIAHNKEGTINPKDIVFIAGEKDLVEVQFVVAVGSDDLTIMDMVGGTTELDFKTYCHFANLVSTVNSNYSAILDDKNKVVIQDKANKEVNIEMLNSDAFLPVKLGFEIISNRKTRSVVIIDAKKMSKKSIDVLLDLCKMVDSLSVIIINNIARYRFGCPVVRV